MTVGFAHPTLDSFCCTSHHLLNPAGDGSGSQSGMDELAGFHLVAIADQRASVGLEREAVAACQHAQRVQRLEAGSQPGNVVSPVEDIMFEGQPGAVGQV